MRARVSGSLGAKLLLGQLLVVIAGALTLLLVAGSTRPDDPLCAVGASQVFDPEGLGSLGASAERYFIVFARGSCIHTSSLRRAERRVAAGF